MLTYAGLCDEETEEEEDEEVEEGDGIIYDYQEEPRDTESKV